MGDFLGKINSIHAAYEAGLYEPALALALTLPDICSKVEYPNEEHVTKRYIEWCDAHIFTETPTDPDVAFTGAALYQLRCHFLHNGDNDIFKDTGATWTQVNINEFDLMEPKDGSGIELLHRIETWKDTDTGNITYKAKMNLRFIIDALCDSAEDFYYSWQNKDEFDDHVVKLLKYSTAP